MLENETKLYSYLKAHTKGAIAWERIETSTGTGIPDANFIIHADNEGVEGWAEFKVVRTESETRVIKLDIRPAQIAWLFRRWQQGSPTYVIVGFPDGRVAFFGGNTAHELAKGRINKKTMLTLAMFHTNVRTDDWLLPVKRQRSIGRHPTLGDYLAWKLNRHNFQRT